MGIPDPALDYYVILGAGFAAVLNHTLLRRQPGPGRIGELPVLHIGESDPWSLYDPAPMGQWPNALTLPGIEFDAESAKPYDFLESAVFAAASARQRATLGCAVLNGRVRTMERVGERYLLQLDSGETVHAAKVDVCTGPGPARRLAPSPGPPHVLTGEEFLQGDALLPAPRSPVAVIGGGPTGAWCVERAQKHGLTVLWVSQESLHRAFLPTRRNDALAQGPLTRNSRLEVDVPLFPAHEDTRFAEGYAVVSLAVSGASIEAVFEARANARVADAGRASLPPLTRERFDRVITAIGQDTEPLERLVHPFLESAIGCGQHRIVDREGRVLGLQSLDESLRVLGAAALSHAEVAREWNTPGTDSSLFFHSLPQQIRVGVGVAVSAVAIALANGYEGPFDNLNVLSEAELADLLGDGLYEDMARTWIEMRASRIHPFTREEMEWILRRTRDRH